MVRILIVVTIKVTKNSSHVNYFDWFLSCDKKYANHKCSNFFKYAI